MSAAGVLPPAPARATYGRARVAPDASPSAPSSPPLRAASSDSGSDSGRPDSSCPTALSPGGSDHEAGRKAVTAAAAPRLHLDTTADDVDDDDDEDPDAYLARFRAKRLAAAGAAPSSSSDARLAPAGLSSDLSSVPPSSNAPAAADSLMPTRASPDAAPRSAARPLRKGGVAGRMRSRAGQPAAMRASPSDASGAEDDASDDSYHSPRKQTKARRTKTVGSAAASASEDDDPVSDGSDSVAHPSTLRASKLQREDEAAQQRRSKLLHMAAQARAKQGHTDAGYESAGDVSSGSDVQIDDDHDALDDVLSMLERKAPSGKSAKPAQSKERRAPHADHKRAGGSHLALTAKAKAPKPLSKQQKEEMHRMTARLERDQKTKLVKAQPVAERKTYGISDLLTRIGGQDAGLRPPAIARARPAPVSDPIEPVPPSSSLQAAPQALHVENAEPDTRAAERRDALAGRDFGCNSRVSPVLAGQSPVLSDDELPDAADLFSAAVAAKEKRERAAKLQLIKQKALEAAQRRVEKGKASTRHGPLSDDSDLEIERDVAPAPAGARTPAAMLGQGRSREARTNHRGSPGAPSSDPPGSDDWITDSQLRVAGRTFGAAAARAAGQASPASAHRRAGTPGRQVDGAPDAPKGTQAPAVSSRRNDLPLAVTKHQLNENMLRRAQQQNLRSRTARDTTSSKPTQSQTAGRDVDATPVSYAEQVRRMLERSSARKQLAEDQQSSAAAADDDDDEDPDWDESADVIDDVVLLGSGSEAEAVESDDGDASDASEDVDVRRGGAVLAANDVEEDSDKENSQPTSSQPCAPLRSAGDGDDDDGTIFAPLPRSRGARRVLSDDEADEDTSRSTARKPFATLPTDSPGRGRKSTGSVGAIAVAPSANFDGGMTQWFQPTAAAQPQAVSPAPQAPRQASLSPVIPRADSFVLGGGGFTQLFQPTAAPAARRPSSPSPQGPSSLLAPSAGAASNASVFGQFFESTQVGAPPRGESLDIIGRLHAESQSMPPPSTTGDAFAALRRAQADEAAAPTASALPSLSFSESDVAHLDAQAERARVEQQMAVNKAPVQYINRHGFFTQTRPGDDDSGQSQSQSQSQSQAALWDATQAPEGSRLPASLAATVEASGETPQDPSPATGPEISARSRKRFRRARQESDDDEEPATGQTDSGSPRASRSGSPLVAHSPAADERGSEEEAEDLDEEDEDLHQASQDSMPQDAFAVLREAASRRSAGPETTKKRGSAFVEGEAEESDEDNEGRVTRGNGGLQGIFSDDGESGNEDDEDEEDDGKDLEGLMNDEREEDEAIKDRLALARYQEDIDKDDAAALALHEKAVRGGLRTGRRGRARDAGDLGDVLDDDWDEEDLLRRAQGLRAPLAKKRKLEGIDGMDLLAQSEESQAFVRTYVETHRNEDELEQYAFLAGGEEDASEDEEDRSRAPRRGSDDDLSSDEAGDAGPQPERITHRDIVRQIREQRRKRKSGAVLDEDDEAALAAQAAEDAAAAEAQRRTDPFYDSDEEMSMLHAPLVSARVAMSARPSHGAPHGSNMAFDRRGPAAHGDDDDEESQSAMSMLLQRGPRRGTLTEQERMRRLQSEWKEEPAWGQSHGNAGARRGAGGAGSSVTSFGARPAARSGDMKRAATTLAPARGALARTNMRKSGSESVLAGLDIIMKRSGRVEESQ